MKKELTVVCILLVFIVCACGVENSAAIPEEIRDTSVQEKDEDITEIVAPDEEIDEEEELPERKIIWLPSEMECNGYPNYKYKYTYDEQGNMLTSENMWGDITEYDGNRTTYADGEHRWTRETAYDEHGTIISETFVSPEEGGAGEKFNDEYSDEIILFDEYYENEYENDMLIKQKWTGYYGNGQSSTGETYYTYNDEGLQIEQKKIYFLRDAYMGDYEEVVKVSYIYDENGQLETETTEYEMPEYHSETVKKYHYDSENPEVIAYVEHDDHRDMYSYISMEVDVTK